MLAIKECLMREGVLNLVGCANNNNNNNSGNNNNNRNSGRNFIDNNYKNQLKRSGSSNMDMLRYQKSVTSQNVDLENNSASSNLSSTSATANNTSCQQQQQLQQTQFSKLPSNKSGTRYQGQHPHFRHHTTPAYYTDVHLRIHTPDAADVAALNENYQSVYNTPSKLVAGEHFFPKTTTATVAPPPISNKSSTSPKTPSPQLRQHRTSTSGAFFRGGSVGNEQHRKSLEPYVRSSPTCVNPIKGDLNNFSQYTNQPDGSNVVFSCINFKKPQTLTTETRTENETAPQPSTTSPYSQAVERKAASATPPTPASGRTSRNPHRFSNRKRAVRVRSESRPISALYEIICKEKGLDIGTTTNDEDSSASSTGLANRHDDNNNNNNNNDFDNNVHNHNKTHNNNNSKTHDSMSVKSIESPALVRPTPTNTTTNRERRDSNSSSHDYTKRSSHTRYAGIHSKKKKENNVTSMLIHDLADDDTDDDQDLKILKAGPRPYSKAAAHKSAKANALSSFSSHSAEDAASQASLLGNKASEQMLHQQQQIKARNHHINYNHNHSPLHSLHPSNHSPLPLRSSQRCSPPDLALDSSTTTTTTNNSQKAPPLCDLNIGLPVKLYVEPIQMRLSSTSPLSPKKDHSSRSGAYQQQRRLRDEKRRNTDGSASMIPTAVRSDNVGSDGDQQCSSLSGLSHTSGAKRFITRPSRNTPLRVSGGAVSSHHSDSSSASPSPVPPPQSNAVASTLPILPVPETAAHEQNNSLSLQGAVDTTANGNHIRAASVPASVAIDSTVVPSVKPLAPSVMTNSAAPCTTTPATVANYTTTANVTAVGNNSGINNSTGANIVSAIKSPTYQQRKCDHTLFKCNNNNNNNNNYATPITNFTTTNANIAITITNAAATTTSGSVLKSTATTPTPIVKLRKKPLSPLIITHQPPQEQQLQQPDQQQHFCPLIATPLTPNSPVAHFVRTTKTSRLRAAALDKKKDEEQQQQQRYSTPPSPHRHAALSSSKISAATNRRHSSSSDNQKSPGGGSEKTSISASPTKRLPLTSKTERRTGAAATACASDISGNKKLVPSMSVSMKQNLSEMHFNGGLAAIPLQNSTNTGGTKNKNVHQQRPHTTDCTVRIVPSTATSAATKSTMETVDDNSEAANSSIIVNDIVADIVDIACDDNDEMRPRCSTMNEDSRAVSSKSTSSKVDTLELSPVEKRKSPELLQRRHEDRDKSSKRKSNLNRSQNEEATADDDAAAAARRRRRRELGMARQLIPGDDPALREIISPHKAAHGKTTPRNDLAYHMEMARRGLDLISPTTEKDQRRAKTASPKNSPETRFITSNGKFDTSTVPSYSSRASRRCDTLPLGGELRKMRSNDVNRKLNERTKSQLAEILRIAEMADAADGPIVPPPSPRSNDLTSHSSSDPIVILTESMNRIEAKHERVASPTKEVTTVTVPDTQIVDEQQQQSQSASDTCVSAESSTSVMRQRMLKARSVEREQLQENPKFSPILRRKSTADEPSQSSLTSTTSSSSTMVAAHNHIVSILKKKDHIAGESSSASSNASPVTFSANVVDTPTKQKRAGILKKRSSLDESRYYSRSHSPDERSILVKSARRNSLEEIAAASQQHGILKQSSYDSSKSDGCPSATDSHPHGILKKKDSTSTPSDSGSHAPKHVSISQAVILAAAELCKDSAEAAVCEYEEGYTPSNEEYEIRPILKLESASSDDVMRQPKPILKKKSSGDSDEHEIRPILKTSRKSSREEFDVFASGSQSDDAVRHFSEPSVRPILKTDSPSKRRSLGEVDATSGGQLSLLKRRTRSLERSESPSALASPPVIDLAAALNAIVPESPQAEFILKPTTISVADRIKSMEKFLHTSTSSSSALDGEQPTTSWESSSLHSGAVPKLLRPSAIKRELCRDRYKTTPVTSDEKNLLFKTASPSPFETTNNSIAPTINEISVSAFKPTKSLNVANFDYADLSIPTMLPQKNPLTRSATQPMDFQLGSTAHSISVADRIKSMEQFLNNTGNTSLPLDVHSAAENATIAANASLKAATAAAAVTTSERSIGGGLKRDLYRDRYKTTPLTSDEKSAFYKPAVLSPHKSETQPVAVPAPSSAFKPTKAFDSSNYITYANLSQPTSTFQLARSLTQPISTLYTESSSAPDEISGLLTQPLHTTNKSHICQNTNSVSDTLNDTSEHLSLSLRSSDNERIFEMSGMDDENKSSSSLLDNSNHTASGAIDEEATSGSTLARKNSVRARANMFSQLEEKTKATAALNREERALPRRAPLRLSSTSSTSTTEPPHDAALNQTSTIADDDDEPEPSLLPLAERLRFFSNLSNSSNSPSRINRNFYTRSNSQQQNHSFTPAGVNLSNVERSSSASNYSYYAPNISRNSMSNTSTSSASVTPTPMDCSLMITDDDTDNLSLNSLHETHSAGDIVKSSSAFIKLSKSASHNLVTTTTTTQTRNLEPPNTTVATLTPTMKRIKLNTIGKLMLPQTFLNANDRNKNINNCSSSNSCNNSESSDNAGSDINDRKPTLKKIGKIKSLFIENCHQQQPSTPPKPTKYEMRLSQNFQQFQQHTHALAPLNNATSNFNVKPNANDYFDSGKENYDSVNSDKLPQVTTPPVIEMRKKFVRSHAAVSLDSSPAAPPPQRNTYGGTSSAPRIDEKYAKYFGLSTAAASDNIAKRNKQNIAPKLQTQRHIDFDDVMMDENVPLAAAVNPNVRITSVTPSASLTLIRTEYIVDSPLMTPSNTPNTTPRNTSATVELVATANVSLKRRDVNKRRLTTNGVIPSNPPQTATNMPAMRTPGAGAGVGVGRSLRAGRPHTITFGIEYVPQVQKFEDIVITEEELQLAEREFESLKKV